MKWAKSQRSSQALFRAPDILLVNILFSIYTRNISISLKRGNSCVTLEVSYMYAIEVCKASSRYNKSKVFKLLIVLVKC